MNYELLKKEFGKFGSFLVWDDFPFRNGLPKDLDKKEFRDKNLNNDFLYLAMNIRLDNKSFPEMQNSRKAFLTNKEAFKDDLPDFFMFHGIDKEKFNIKPYTLFNNLITGTCLEGSYATDFFKVSPKSKIPDGYATVREDDVYDYIDSLDEKEKSDFIGYQLKALDREVELLGNDQIKILVMSTIYEKVKSYFDKYLDEDKYPHLYKAKLIDKPPAFGTVLNTDILKVIYTLIKNVSKNDYPKFLIGSIYQNMDLIKGLITIEEKAELLGIFYLSLGLDDKLDKNIGEFLEKIKDKHDGEIKEVRSKFSREIILELIKNFGEISYQLTEDRSFEKYEEFHSKVLENIKEENTLIYDNSNQRDFLKTIKVIGIQDKSFIVEDFYSFVIISLIKKALKLDGDIYYKDYSQIKDKNYKMFFAKVDESKLDKIYHILTFSEIKVNKLLIETNYFESIYLKDFRDYLVDYKNIYTISMFDNKFMVLNMGEDSKDIEINYIDKKFELIYKDYIDKKVLKNKKVSLELNPKKEENIYVKIKDLTEIIAKGYPLNNIRDQGLEEYSTKDLKDIKNYDDYIIYLENRHINKGIIDYEDAFVFKKDKKAEKYKIAKKGDLIISKNPPYYLVIVDDDLNYVVNENLFLIKPIKEKINPYYLFAALQSIISQDISKISNKNHVSIKSLKNVGIKIYSNNRRKKLADETKTTIEEIKTLTKRLEDLLVKKARIFNG